ncbi:alpha/beta hydrolase [Shewanella algae]|uniref:alpha/beta hydrolase n=1 Tax=Shewanella algae TaxID=38313 RepID=UPI0031F4E3A3
MPLNPQVETFLQQTYAAGFTPYEDLAPEAGRHQEHSDIPPARPPEEMAAVEHRFIPGPTADLPVRIYRPKHSEQPQPALIYFHGSGWMVSNIEINDPFSRALAKSCGVVVIAVNYQKAPEHKFPIPMDDCYAATLWVFKHAERLGLDPKRIGIFGDSAGANLAAAVALRCRDEDSADLACQVLVYPPVQYGWHTASAEKYATGFLLHKDSMKYYWNHYLRSPADAIHPYCSPLLATDHSNLPTTLLYCAECDPLCDDSRLYADKLATSGVAVHYQRYPGTIHGFIKMLGVFDQADEFQRDVGAQVRELLAVKD